MTDTINEKSPAPTLDRYLEFWNADPGPALAELAREVFTDDIRYVAPIGEYAGIAALVGLRRQFQEHLGTVVFQAGAAPEFHHDRARLRWEVVRGEEPFATGTEVLRIREDGRISEVTAFLDRAPEGFDPGAH